MSATNDQAIASGARTYLEREVANLRHLGDCRFSVVAELGRQEVPLSQLKCLKTQDVIDLDKLAGEGFDLRVNGHAFAEGEIVVVADTMAIRITSMAHSRDMVASVPVRPVESRAPEAEAQADTRVDE